MLKFLRRLSALTVKPILGLLALIVLTVVFGLFANHRAIQAAENFCDQIAIGSDLTQSVEAARSQGVRYIESLHQFRFQGWVFNAALCIVTVEDNKVLSRRVEMRGD